MFYDWQLGEDGKKGTAVMFLQLVNKMHVLVTVCMLSFICRKCKEIYTALQYNNLQFFYLFTSLFIFIVFLFILLHLLIWLNYIIL